MRATTVFSLLSLFLPTVFGSLGGLPNKIYGVNLGSWLVLESWMLPQEWLDMGGEQCDDCSTCIATEFAFAKAYPDTVDEIFDGHWTSWFNQPDVNALKANGINTVRIPLGYWIVEALVDRATEFYPRGGLAQLRRGLQQLNEAGIVAILDHHALPGVAAVKQQFAGNCITTPLFYTDYNYHRALIWTSVMTALSHVDPAHPVMVTFQQNFVKVVRATEFCLGVKTPGVGAMPAPADGNCTAMLSQVNGSIFTDEVRSVLLDAGPILMQLGVGGLSQKKTQLVTSFMDINWQYNNPANPADAAIGPQGYDNHLYYSFGGVANADPVSYMTSICNLKRVQNDAALGNSPLWFGEWGLPTQFSPTDAFLRQWADAQKLMYSQGAGWIFWNFKVEISDLAGGLGRQWSYLEGVKRGYLTKDPSKYNNPDVCVPYIRSKSAAVSGPAGLAFADGQVPY
ncbi:Glycoside hydrolase [Mycena sanguinolenta]|uniref:Glycoside hydrolase n=1 Tax=Mycena sanguinolenta TaxID=230812 RepID=A0A8H6Z5L6_9AGAR|nr:Glycoside hydrolase [Mycena sanguinolenta]